MRSENLNELHLELDSPLAALRNALHMIATQSDDFMVQEYVKLAEAETQVIADALSGTPEELQRRQKAA